MTTTNIGPGVTKKTFSPSNGASAKTAPKPVIDVGGMENSELARLRAENEALKAAIAAKSSGNINFKVSEKGGVSVMGLQRFPVTLYRDQWVKLLGKKEALLAFIEAHSAELSSK